MGRSARLGAVWSGVVVDVAVYAVVWYGTVQSAGPSLCTAAYITGQLVESHSTFDIQWRSAHRTRMSCEAVWPTSTRQPPTATLRAQSGPRSRAPTGSNLRARGCPLRQSALDDELSPTQRPCLSSQEQTVTRSAVAHPTRLCRGHATRCRSSERSREHRTKSRWRLTTDGSYCTTIRLTNMARRIRGIHTETAAASARLYSLLLLPLPLSHFRSLSARCAAFSVSRAAFSSGGCAFSAVNRRWPSCWRCPSRSRCTSAVRLCRTGR